MKITLSAVLFLAVFSITDTYAAPLVWGSGNWGEPWQDVDTDGDGYTDSQDAFPFNITEWLDTDVDSIGNNADLDDDNDSVPDYIDADSLNAAVNTEITFPVNGGYKGSAVIDRQGVQ